MFWEKGNSSKCVSKKTGPVRTAKCKNEISMFHWSEYYAKYVCASVKIEILEHEGVLVLKGHAICIIANIVLSYFLECFSFSETLL